MYILHIQTSTPAQKSDTKDFSTLLSKNQYGFHGFQSIHDLVIFWHFNKKILGKWSVHNNKGMANPQLIIYRSEANYQLLPYVVKELTHVWYSATVP